MTKCAPWSTVIEAHVDVRTTSGYLLHLFSVDFTKKHNNHLEDLEDLLRSASTGPPNPEKIMENRPREMQTNDLKKVVNKLLLNSVGKDIEKA